MLSRLLTLREQMVLAGLATAIVVGAAALYFHGPTDGIAPVALPATPETPPAPPPPAEKSEPTQKPDTPRPRLDPAAQAPQVEPVASSAPPPPSPKIGVGILGAVRRPGLYFFPPDTRVARLLRTAGPLETADLSDINQAARLLDGTTLVIPLGLARDQKWTPQDRRINDAALYNPAAYTLSRSSIVEERFGPEETPAEDRWTAPGPDSGGAVDLNTATQAELEALPGIGSVLAGRIMEYRARAPFTAIEDLRQVEGIGQKKFEVLQPFITVSASGP